MSYLILYCIFEILCQAKNCSAYDFMPECHKDRDFSTAIYSNNDEETFVHKCIDIDITCIAHLSHLWSNINESEKNGKSSNKARKNA